MDIFGPLDKRQRAATDAAAAAETGFSFEDRADLLNDLLEDDTTTFPLLSCPPEVLAAVLLLSEASTAVRMRPVCAAMRVAIDSNDGLWCAMTIRDFADLGGLTKHYRGLRTLADAWDASRAVRRLEWDPLMICAPAPLRYALLAAGEARRRLWNEHGHALGAGWTWFSAKVCRRMAASTFLRWAAPQHGEAAVLALLAPLGLRDAGSSGATPPGLSAGGSASSSTAGAAAAEGGAAAAAAEGGAQQFRCGRSDSVRLSAEAVSDIYETVQRWHSKEHIEMMRAHFQRPGQSSAPGRGAAGKAIHSAPLHGGSFSVTPTLDAAEAAAIAVDSLLADQPPAVDDVADAGAGRGAASRRIEEAQLRLALELSRAEAESADGGATAAPRPADAANTPTKQPPPAEATTPQPEQAGLALKAEGSPGLMVFLKDNCLGQRVEHLPEALDRSIEHIVHKMTTPTSWALLYESITEELGFRAKSAAHALCTAQARAVDSLLSGDGAASLEQERMCLPIWRSSARWTTDLSQLRATTADPALRRARCDLLRQASLEWCEMEDFTEFLDSQLAPLELAIDNFRGAHEASSKAHTPHVRDIGRLTFRNCCLLDSRVFRPLCLAAYALVHEVHSADDEEGRLTLTETLEGFHAMVIACDVADDHLSASKDTKDAFVESLVVPITAALERLADYDVRGHPSRDVRPRAPRGLR